MGTLHSRANVGNGVLYARDKVHPSPVGHALAGLVAARYVAQRVRATLCAVPRRGPMEKPRTDGDEGLPDGAQELCYGRADLFPLAQPLTGSWSIVDEGGRWEGLLQVVTQLSHA